MKVPMRETIKSQELLGTISLMPKSTFLAKIDECIIATEQCLVPE